MSLTGVGLEIKIGDKDYTFAPFTFEDLEWLELRTRAKAIEAGRMSIPASASQAERDQMMDAVLTNAQKISVLNSTDQLFTPSGVAVILQRMVAGKHPEVDLSTAMSWVTDPDVMSQVMPQLALLAPKSKKNEQVAETPKHKSRKSH